MSKQDQNSKAVHPLQSEEWGEFRKKTGVGVVRKGGIQVTIHPIPYTNLTVGYAPKIPKLDGEVVKTLKSISKEYNCIFVKVEPEIELKVPSQKVKEDLTLMGFVQGRSLFTKYNFVLDVTPSLEILLANMKQKTRYNIRVAERRGVVVEIDNTQAAFESYLQLTKETTSRQGFYSHNDQYHRLMWETLNQPTTNNQQLTAHLLVAKLDGVIITAWMLLKSSDTLYYPYGASTREHREVMANNLVMWEAIKLAKSWGLKYLDMWGALGPDPDKNDPWYGFHSFKQGYGARHVEYIGTWDYVERPILYQIYNVAEKLRWATLRLATKILKS